MEKGSLAMGRGLSNHSTIGWLVSVDGFEDVVEYWDAVDCLKVQVTVVKENKDWYENLD